MTTVLRLDAARKRYGAVEALAGVDLEVHRGEVVALLGPNGAGKTTAFELLLGLARPTGGTVRVLGQAPGGRVRNRIGAMLQGAGLPEQVRVHELVRVIGRAYPHSRPVDVVLHDVGLHDRRERTVTDLSGGERQRLLLAMALVGAPELLLLDEPTAAMDVDSRRAFWQHARTSVRDGATIVFATHDLPEADTIADRIVVLQHGRVVADAPPAELKQLVTGKVVRVCTDAPAALVSGLPGVERVQAVAPGAKPPPEGTAPLLLHVADAEQVVVGLVRGGFRLADLTVADADLEDAFVRLTAPGRDPCTTAPVPTLSPRGAAR